MAEIQKACLRCGVEFEPKTPKLTRDRLKRHNFYHVGCFMVEIRAYNG